MDTHKHKRRENLKIGSTEATLFATLWVNKQIVIDKPSNYGNVSLGRGKAPYATPIRDTGISIGPIQIRGYVSFLKKIRAQGRIEV